MLSLLLGYTGQRPAENWGLPAQALRLLPSMPRAKETIRTSVDVNLTPATPVRKPNAFVATFVVLLLAAFFLRHFSWRGSVLLHSLLELSATLLSLFVGILALVRFYSKQDNIFLFVGASFLGTGLLDALHTVATLQTFMPYSSYASPATAPWSWFASRLFLSVLLWLSWLIWRREAKQGERGKARTSLVYSLFVIWILACFLFFVFVPLPYVNGRLPLFHRPQEIVPAFFFLLALVGYWRKGRWKNDSFEYWLVLSLIVGLVGQLSYMSTSAHRYDTMFIAAHLLKILSYACVLVGLVASMYRLFLTQEAIVDERTRLLRDEIEEGQCAREESLALLEREKLALERSQ
jgi:hypothetical protein